MRVCSTLSLNTLQKLLLAGTRSAMVPVNEEKPETAKTTMKETEPTKVYERETCELTLRPGHLASLVPDTRSQVVLAFSRN